jgi:hypothetical protein
MRMYAPRPSGYAPLRVHGRIRIKWDSAYWLVYSHRSGAWGIGSTVGAALADYAGTLGMIAALTHERRRNYVSPPAPTEDVSAL